MIKKALPYFLIIILCITAYLFARHLEKSIIIQKRISYTTANASEVYMAWGIIDQPLPPQTSWPQNSHLEKDLVYTKLSKNNQTFFCDLNLPHGSELYYWMVQTKSIAGDTIEIWDTGDVNKIYYIQLFEDKEIFRPGYFIFLAGLAPLLLFYFKQRNKILPVVRISSLQIKEYIPQLDSIRAIAVLLVILHHWLPTEHWIHHFPNGPLGVNIFFVLSGFLITTILLKQKEDVEDKHVSRRKVFKNFYIRRSLRIFPIYYLLLIFFWFLNDPEILKNGVYYFTYTSNFLFYKQEFFPRRLAHLWSLAIEEQFYLIWPFLMIFVSKKWLPFVIGMFLTIGISTNYIITSKGWWVKIITPACFDAFAVGAMLSFCSVYRNDIIQIVRKKYNWILLLSFAVLISDILGWHMLPSRTVHSLFAGCLVFYCLYQNNNRISNSILNNKWLQSMGKISYGIYLYHLFIPEMWDTVIKYASSHNVDLLYNRSIPSNFKTTWLFIQYFIVVILLSKLSWHLIEKRVNLLKSMFTNKKIPG